MHRKLIAACLTLAAIAAFAVPSVASAKPELTFPTGTTLGEGATLEATNVGQVTFKSGAFTVHCTIGRFAGTLKGNTGTEIGWEISAVELGGTGANGDCTSGVGAVKFLSNTGTNGTPWCLRATSLMTEHAFEIRGGLCGNSRPIRFALDITPLGKVCTYEHEFAVGGSYTTHPNDAVGTITEVGFTRVAGEAMVCPTEMRMNMSFTIEKDAAGAEPVYIS
jgi:hypothetical protein